VDRILQEEQSARSSVERAQNQSQEIVLRAKEEARSLVKDAVDKAEGLARKSKEDAQMGFLAERERMLSEARESADLSRSRKEQDIAKTARDIFLEIIKVKG